MEKKGLSIEKVKDIYIKERRVDIETQTDDDYFVKLKLLMQARVDERITVGLNGEFQIENQTDEGYFKVLKKLIEVPEIDWISKLHIAHYGVTKGGNDGSKFMVRKGEIGETAHMIFSWLTCFTRQNPKPTRQIHVQQANGEQALIARRDTLNKNKKSLKKAENEELNGIEKDLKRIENLANLQKETIKTLEVFEVTIVELKPKEVIDLKMESYNNGPLALMCNKGMRSEVNKRLRENKIIHEDVILEIERIVKPILDKKMNSIVIWYKQPKVEVDRVRMNYIYQILQKLEVKHIIWMGDAPDKYAKCNATDGAYKKFDPEALYNKVKPTGVSCTFVTTRDMPEIAKTNLLYQWILCAGVTNALKSVMVCPSRTGGSHGPYLLGTPLVYFDKFDGNSFLKERMAIHALVDNLLTPVPFGRDSKEINVSMQMMDEAIQMYKKLQESGCEDIFNML